MSKYNPLWERVASSDRQELVLTYEEIESVLGFPIDHSFLSFKKELAAYGWRVDKISMKDRRVKFSRNSI